MHLRDCPSSNHPRRRLAHGGPTALSEVDLLAIWLGCGRRGRTAVAMAHALLAEFGSLRGVLRAPVERLKEHPGIGPSRLAQLQIVLELARRHHREELLCGPSLTDPSLARDFLRTELRDLAYEAFCLIYLDSRYRVTGFEPLFRGTIDCAQVHPREVVRRALEVRAAAVILGHNHPSGLPEPSEADKIITRRLRDALGLVEIRVLDHVIVGEGGCVSLAELGLL
jgi:DNA repair protein RadC